MISWKEQKLPGKEHFFTSITKYLSTRKVLNDEEKLSTLCFVSREERQHGKVRSENATKIQSIVRGYLARTRTKKLVLSRFDHMFPVLEDAAEPSHTNSSVQMFSVAKLFINMINPR